MYGLTHMVQYDISYIPYIPYTVLPHTCDDVIHTTVILPHSISYDIISYDIVL